MALMATVAVSADTRGQSPERGRGSVGGVRSYRLTLDGGRLRAYRAGDISPFWVTYALPSDDPLLYPCYAPSTLGRSEHMDCAEVAFDAASRPRDALGREK